MVVIDALHLLLLVASRKLKEISPWRRSSARLEQRLHKPRVTGSNPVAAIPFHICVLARISGDVPRRADAFL